MGQLDTIVGWTKKLESALETRLGAEGRGLHEKTGSVEHRLDKDLIRLLRKIATMRNKAMHEDGYVVEDIDRFVKDCEHAHNRIVHLETSKPRSRAPLNTLRVNEPPAWMKASKEAIKRDILKVFSNRRGSEAVLGACQVESGGGGFWKLPSSTPSRPSSRWISITRSAPSSSSTKSTTSSATTSSPTIPAPCPF